MRDNMQQMHCVSSSVHVLHAPLQGPLAVLRIPMGSVCHTLQSSFLRVTTVSIREAEWTQCQCTLLPIKCAALPQISPESYLSIFHRH